MWNIKQCQCVRMAPTVQPTPLPPPLLHLRPPRQHHDIRQSMGTAQDTLEGLCLSAGLGMPPGELEEVSGERDVWVSLLSLLSPRPGPG
ncbi:hypothetical protein AMECASPLE_028597 [Ameca splendens]|uniref:Uncharacterized protein n=1 Tax=Ameca splendens TaxID=208324 RepID=A0ABV0Y5K9_9TELE